MIVQCPKCKTKLKVDETRLKPEGSRMKCPRCAVVLMVRPPKKQAPPQQPPAAPPPRQPEPAPARSGPAVEPSAPPRPTGPVSIPPGTKILVAHSDPKVMNNAVGILMGAGCIVSTAPDGVEAMVKAQEEKPAVALVDVALQKIYGFEVAKRIREQESTAGVRVVLITSVHREDRYRRSPENLHGADGFVEEPYMAQNLLLEVSAVLAKKPAAGKVPPAAAPRVAAEPTPAPGPVSGASRQEREKAERLSRTILSDIELYSPDQVAEAIRDGSFETVFSDELREGRKLYEARVSPELRAEKDFFDTAVKAFIAKKEEQLGI